MVNISPIVVTHFINPHLFWYHEVNAFKEEFQIIKNMEDQLNVMYGEKLLLCQRNLILQVGDPVAVFYLAWNKYIRAEILHRPQCDEEDFVVWATDYGFPFLSKINTMRLMPTDMTKHIDHIRRGGITGIVPGELKFNPCKGGLDFEEQDTWLQRVCNDVQKKLWQTSLITFVDEYQTFNEHHWGNLIITNTEGENLDIRTYLIRSKYGLEIHANFENLLQQLETIKLPRWMSNDGKPTARSNSIVNNHYATLEKRNTNMDVNDSIRKKVEDWCLQQAQLQNASSLANDTGNNEMCHPTNNSDLNHFFDGSLSAVDEPENQRDNAQHHQEEGTYDKIKAINDFNISADEIFGLKLTQGNVINELAKVKLNENKMSMKDAMKLNFPSNEHMCMKPIIHSDNKAIWTQTLFSSETQNEFDVAAGELTEIERMKSKISSDRDLLAESIVTKETFRSPEQFESKAPLSPCTIETLSKCMQESVEICAESAGCDAHSHSSKRTCASNGNLNEIQLYDKVLGLHALATTRVEEEKDKEEGEVFKTDNEYNNGLKPFQTFPTKVQASSNVTNVSDPFGQCKMLPAGFDITRLYKYRDEENHWHRKKTTRFINKPHNK